MRSWDHEGKVTNESRTTFWKVYYFTLISQLVYDFINFLPNFGQNSEFSFLNDPVIIYDIYKVLMSVRL